MKVCLKAKQATVSAISNKAFYVTVPIYHWEQGRSSR